MAKKELFERFFELVKNCEEKNGMPLVICGAFCNTTSIDGTPVIDWEGFDGAGWIWDDDDIREAFKGQMKDFRRELRAGARSFREAFPEAFTNN